MAHQSKFVSVNLNRSYGQPSPSSSSVHGRPRPGSGGGGGSGGMVVLSRARSSASSGTKTAQKLAVPPPMNLPSLRKEHERFDPASSAAVAGHGSSALGSRVGPSASGWSKPALPSQHSIVEKDDSGSGPALFRRPAINGDEIPGGSYMPPGARAGGQPINVVLGQGVTEKAVILRGDDFPSLRATVSSALKQKEASSQKQKQKQGTEDPLGGREVAPESHAPLQMRPQIKSSRLINSNVSDGDGSSIQPLGVSEQSQEDGNLPGPIPLVRLQHTSEWTDDERDTGLSIHERERDRGILRPESVQVHDPYEGRGLRGTEVSNAPSREFYKGDSVGRDTKVARNESQDFGSWRFPLNSRDRLNTNVMGMDRDRHYTRPFSGSREMNVECTNNHSGENGGDVFAKRSQDVRPDRMGLSSPENILNGTVVAEARNGKSAERNIRGYYFDHLNYRSKGSSFSNATNSKVQLPMGSKGTSYNDIALSFNREKRLSPSAAKSYLGDTEYHSKDPFSGDIDDMNVKVLKKKKDFEKHLDFPDPIRKSFEEELERILRMQEQERQLALEEQAKALELARKEEEERERLVREEEERRRLLEEEAKEAAWRAEKERLDAMRRAEEQKLAREEEKKRYMMEEERRKEAARKKLLELEARMERRQSEDRGKDERVPSSDEIVPGEVKERRAAEVGGWGDGDNIAERITSSELSDSSSVERSLDVVSRSQFPRDGIPSFLDRGKHSFGSKIVAAQAEENAYPRHDTFGYRRGVHKKQFHDDAEIISTRPSSKVATMELSQITDEYQQPIKQRWSSKGDYFKSNTDTCAEFDSVKFEDVGMGSGNSYGSHHAPCNEISVENSVVDGLSSSSRNRQFLRQPRVPPPPVMSYVQRSSFENPAERSNLSCFIDDKTHYNHANRYEQKNLQIGYDIVFDQNFQQHGTLTFPEENGSQSEQEPDKMSPRCDSQLSLSVSSPPSSPTLFSHHELDVSRDSPPLPTSADCERTAVYDSEHIVLPLEGGTVDRMMASRSVSPEVDDEWPVANNEEIHEEEVYYEEGDDYEDIAEAHEGNHDNLGAVKEMDDLQTDEVILGFNEGVEVKLPSIDKFEITSSNRKKEFEILDQSSVILEEPIHIGETIFQESTVVNSLKIVSEVEKALEDLSLDEVTTSNNSTNSIEASQSSGMPAQHTLIPASSLPIVSTTANSPILSLPSTAVSQGEAPVSLQFGLFSGPSLIPSPVPAIQIGSIQMPIHLHTQLNPSLPQVHHSQPPLFQFGQLRYTPTISHSILPLPSQSTSFVQSPLPASYANQNPPGCLCNQASQNYTSQNRLQNEKSTGSSVKQSNLVQNNLEYSQGNLLAGQLKASLDPQKNVSISSQNQRDGLTLCEKKGVNDSISQVEYHGDENVTVKKAYRFIAKRKDAQAQQHIELQSSRIYSGEKSSLNTPATLSGGGGRRKRYTYSVKNAGARSLFPVADTIGDNSSGFQRRARRNFRRTGFGVRENIERNQTHGLESFTNAAQDKKTTENSITCGVSIRDIGNKDTTLNRSTKSTDESENGNSDTSTSRVVSSNKKSEKGMGSETPLKNVATLDRSRVGKGSMNCNIEEDVDAPLLSGVVRVYKQTGIEVPSNEDDFIEVRSKRQMLNDRREQRAKENKSKSRAPKTPSKQNVAQNNAKSNLNRVTISSDDGIPNNVCSHPFIGDGKSSSKVEPSVVPTSSQSLPPIVTTSVHADSERRLNELKSIQITAAPSIPDSALMLAPGPPENKNVNPDYSTTSPSSSWDNVNFNNQVIALTQIQLEEAMKTSQFGPSVPCIGLEPRKSVSSAVTEEMPFSASSSSVSSLLPGEKIQFGAVMPPNVLPPVNRAISKGYGHPDSSGPEQKIGRNLSNNYSMFFVKDNCLGEPCATNLEDAEAEAEAAASAVAVAAITNDEIVVSSIVASETKNFNSVDDTSASGGVASSQKVTGQSASEESLTVALPADFCFWSSLPSPQTSQPMLSQFTGGPPSHLPSFETSRILDGCTFAYGSNDESASSQGQSQQAAALGSGPPGTWPQYHSGVDSFYRSTAGFTGPFINPGGIAGVQCPPHMVFYNHFAPVGQFGQVGLGFMGTTYIPAGKQPEWKQNQVCPTIGDNDGDLSNANVASSQGTPTSLPVPNLAPGSPLMAVAPPLTMFDISPFQSTANIPLQPWPHVPAPLHSIPLSMPLQQHQVESRMPTQFGWNQSGDAATGNNRFAEPRPSVSTEISRNIPFPNSSGSEISDELSRVKQPTSSTAVQTTKPSDSIASGNEKKIPKTAVRPIGSVVNDSGGTSASNNNGTGQMAGLLSKTQGPTPSGQQHHHQVGYAEQQYGISQRTSSAGEWHNRRAGYHIRKQGSGIDKNIGPKVKQIYVAKPSTNPLLNHGQMKG